MSSEQPPPPLKLLHSEDCLIQSKLAQIECLPTDRLVQCMAPARRDCLKTRPDGTIIDGNHRAHVLRKRAVNVDGLPREIILKEES